MCVYIYVHVYIYIYIYTVYNIGNRSMPWKAATQQEKQRQSEEKHLYLLSFRKSLFPSSESRIKENTII